MSEETKKFKAIGRQAWQLCKWSIPMTLAYIFAGVMLMLTTLEEGQTLWSGEKLGWTLVCALAAVAYNALVAYSIGGTGYEMLVSGNIKRSTMDAYGGGYKISSHKYVKEYRVWKGFAFGGFAALCTVVFGILFGCNQESLGGQTLNAEIWTLNLVGYLISGWTLLPITYLNASGVSISYFVSCAFAIVPIAVSGVFYILGAYGKRNKAIKQQKIADEIAAAKAAKEKKINYGGLPGTKPKKRK